MISVISSKLQPQYLKQLRDWFVLEWGEVDPFEGTGAGFELPPPLLALDEEKLLGGLSFTSSAIPGSKELGLWVNALLVAPDHRGLGVGSQLIKAAEIEADCVKAKKLFVYTNVPHLYERLGWLTVESSTEYEVLERTVA